MKHVVLGNSSHLWDSTAKVQTGLLTGNLNALGNFDECLNVTNPNGNFNGEYCLATLQLGNTTADDALGTMLKHVIDEEGGINIGFGAQVTKGLRWGFCIPSSCNYNDLSTSLSQELQNVTNIEVSVGRFDCSINEHQPYSKLDWITIVMFILLLCAVLLSTGYEFFTVFRKHGEWWVSRSTSSSGPNLWNKTSLTSLTPSPILETLARLSQKPKTSSVVNMPCTGPTLERPKFLNLSNINRPSSRTPSPMEEIVHDQSCSKSPHSKCSGSSSLSYAVESPIAKEYDLLACFSVYSNGLKLLRPNKSMINIGSIDGLKVLSLLWVVIANACLISESLPAMSYINIRKFAGEWPSMLILNAQLAADTLMVCTGALISFNFLKDMKKRGIYRRHSNSLERTGISKCFLVKYMPLWYLHRYIRVTPALGAIILLQTSLLNHLGSGPFWVSGNDYLRNVCREKWWSTLLYVGNYLNPDKMCLSHSWYLMVDMQLYIFSPIILICFLCWTARRNLIVSGIVILLGVVCNFLVNWVLELPAGFVNESDKWLMKMKYDYIATHTRFSPWMIGMALGYIIYQYHIGGGYVQLPNWCTKAAWTFTPVFLLYAMFGLIVFECNGCQMNPVWPAMYNGIFHAVWALGIAWIIFACETEYGGIVKVILYMKMFCPLSRLTYSMYLVHMPLMMYRALTVRVPIHGDGGSGISLFFGDLLLSFVLAILLSLCIELPMRRLLRAFTMHCNFTVRSAPRMPSKKLLREYAPLLAELEQSIAASLSE